MWSKATKRFALHIKQLSSVQDTMKHIIELLYIDICDLTADISVSVCYSHSDVRPSEGDCEQTLDGAETVVFIFQSRIFIL